jgi:hypothetical protein
MLKTVLENIGQQVVAGITNGLDKYNRNASGKTKRSLRYEVTDKKVSVFGESNLFQLEYGRGATKNKTTRTFTVATIEAWIVAKGIQPTGIPLKSLAYLIWRKINRKGYEGTKGVLTDTINPENIKKWTASVAITEVKSIVKGIKEFKNGINS